MADITKIQLQNDNTIYNIKDETAVRKDTEASVSSIKILHDAENSDATFIESATISDKETMVVNTLTLRGDPNGSIDYDTVILRNLHPGEEPTDAVNLSQLEPLVRFDRDQGLTSTQQQQARTNIGAAQEIAPEKKYGFDSTLIQSIELANDTPIVSFTLDNEGNPLRLQSFMIRIDGLGFINSASTLYMRINNTTSVIGNGKIPNLPTDTPRRLNISCTLEPGGILRAEHTAWTASNGFTTPGNPIAESRVVSGDATGVISQIHLYTALPTGESNEDQRKWRAGNKFELYGVKI